MCYFKQSGANFNAIFETFKNVIFTLQEYPQCIIKMSSKIQKMQDNINGLVYHSEQNTSHFNAKLICMDQQ